MEMDVKVGDTVVVLGSLHRRYTEATVVKVGRKYVHVQMGRGSVMTFDKESGSGTESYSYIRTQEQYADERKREKISTDLRTQFGMNFDYKAPKYTTEQLEKLLTFMVELTA